MTGLHLALAVLLALAAALTGLALGQRITWTIHPAWAAYGSVLALWAAWAVWGAL